MHTRQLGQYSVKAVELYLRPGTRMAYARYSMLLLQDASERRNPERGTTGVVSLEVKLETDRNNNHNHPHPSAFFTVAYFQLGCFSVSRRQIRREIEERAGARRVAFASQPGTGTMDLYKQLEGHNFATVILEIASLVYANSCDSSNFVGQSRIPLCASKLNWIALGHIWILINLVRL